MKNTKHSRILILVLSLVVLICAMVGFSVSAEGVEYTNEIVSMNIAYGDTVQVLIALDAPLDNQEGITVKYIDPNGDEQTATYWKTMDVNGTERPVWYTNGISAKDLGQDVVATVYVNGEAISTENVSVAYYLYTKLYKEGFVNATEGTDLHKKELYQNLLTYAASAETALWNDKAENASNQRVLITDKRYVYAVDGTVDADKTIEDDVLTTGETVTLTFNGTVPEGYEFTNFWLSTIDGNSLIEDGVPTVPTVHGVYKPVFKSTAAATGGKYYTSDIAGTRYDFDTKLNLDVAGGNYADLSVYNAETNPNGILAAELDADATGGLITDKTTTLDNSTGALVFNMNSYDWTGFNLAYKGDTKGAAGTKYVFEADFTYLDGAAYTGSGTSDNIPIYMGATSKNEKANYMHAITDARYFGNYNGLRIGGTVLAKGVSYSLRIVYTVGGGYEVYVNDLLVDTTPDTKSTKASDYSETTFTGFGIYVRQRNAGDNFSFSLDNVYMGTVNSYYDTLDYEGTRYDFTDSFEVSTYDAETNPTGLLAGTITDDDEDALQTKKTLSLTNTDSRLLVDMTTREWAGFTIANKEAVAVEEGSVHIAEFDFTYLSNTAYTGTSTVNYNAFAFGISCSGGALNSMNYYNNVYHKDNTYEGSLTYKTAVFEMNKTYKIRIESTVGGDELIYVDNVLVSTNGGSKGNAYDPYTYAGIGFYFRDRNAGDSLSFAIDNLFMTTLDPK